MKRSLRRYLPNRIGDTKLATVALADNGAPLSRAWRPFRALQLIGGRRWTLSVIRVGEVQVAAVGPVNRMDVEEAYDALTAEDSDPIEAAELLRRALHQ